VDRGSEEAAPGLAKGSPRRMNKLILLLVDGLRADTARDYLGYVQALNEAGRAHWSSLRCELPSLSRPLYATVLNGRTPLDHGILGNSQAGQRCGSTVFDDLAAAGRTSAIAAYHWVFELLAPAQCGRCPLVLGGRLPRLPSAGRCRGAAPCA
jgi:predicted AlkP superfamily phosphohydrolase/phosphomutase